MRLQDAVMTAPPLVIQSKTGKVHHLPGADTLADQLRATPVRYVLDDASAALVTNTAFASNNMLGQSLDLLRFPCSSFWVEWDDRGRAKVLRELGIVDPHFDGSAKHRRAGALVRADDEGRRGEISIFWENEEGGADLSPFTIHFDLGAPGEAGPSSQEQTYGVNIGSVSELGELYDCATFSIAKPWREYIETYMPTAADAHKAIEQNLASIACDFAYISTFCLLLSVRGALNYQSNDLTRLNAARKRKGAQPLLDYLSVSLDLDGAAAPEGAGPEGGPRSARRLHHVCGHLVRRQSSLFWRRAHMRGDPSAGVIAARSISVTSLRRRAI